MHHDYSANDIARDLRSFEIASRGRAETALFNQRLAGDDWTTLLHLLEDAPYFTVATLVEAYIRQVHHLSIFQACEITQEFLYFNSPLMSYEALSDKLINGIGRESKMSSSYRAACLADLLVRQRGLVKERPRLQGFVLQLLGDIHDRSTMKVITNFIASEHAIVARSAVKATVAFGKDINLTKIQQLVEGCDTDLIEYAIDQYLLISHNSDVSLVLIQRFHQQDVEMQKRTLITLDRNHRQAFDQYFSQLFAEAKTTDVRYLAISLLRDIQKSKVARLLLTNFYQAETASMRLLCLSRLRRGILLSSRKQAKLANVAIENFFLNPAPLVLTKWKPDIQGRFQNMLLPDGDTKENDLLTLDWLVQQAGSTNEDAAVDSLLKIAVSDSDQREFAAICIARHFDDPLKRLADYLREFLPWMRCAIWDALLISKKRVNRRDMPERFWLEALGRSEPSEISKILRLLLKSGDQQSFLFVWAQLKKMPDIYLRRGAEILSSSFGAGYLSLCWIPLDGYTKAGSTNLALAESFFEKVQDIQIPPSEWWKFFRHLLLSLDVNKAGFYRETQLAGFIRRCRDRWENAIAAQESRSHEDLTTIVSVFGALDPQLLNKGILEWSMKDLHLWDDSQVVRFVNTLYSINSQKLTSLYIDALVEAGHKLWELPLAPFEKAVAKRVPS